MKKHLPEKKPFRLRRASAPLWPEGQSRSWDYNGKNPKGKDKLDARAIAGGLSKIRRIVKLPGGFSVSLVNSY